MTRSSLVRGLGRCSPTALAAGLFTIATATVLLVTPTTARSPLPPDDEPSIPDAPLDPDALAPRGDPAALRPALEDPSVALELAAHLASRGNAEAARDVLGSVAFDPEGDALRTRVTEELERVEAWIKTRDRFLQLLVSTERKLEVPHGDKRRRLKIERVEGGALHFAENRWKIESLRVTELDPLTLAREMGNKKLGFDAGRVRLYMYALCGDKRWKGLLKGDEPEVQRLRTAGEIEYPAWVLRGRTHFALLELSETPAPTDAESGTAMLARIHELVAQYSGRGELEAARSRLADLAEFAQYVALSSGSLAELFEGTVAELDEGRVRITYDFADEGQLRDFESGRYPLDGNGFYRKHDSPNMRVEEGGLIAQEQGCLRTVATFEGPIKARYRYRAINDRAMFGLMVGVHDSGDGYMLRAMGAMILWWSDPDRTPPLDSAIRDGSITYSPRAEYEIELALDEKGKATLSRNGETYVEMDNCPREEGAVFLGLEGEQGAKFRILELVIEGKLTAEARQALRLRRSKRAGDELRTP